MYHEANTLSAQCSNFLSNQKHNESRSKKKRHKKINKSTSNPPQLRKNRWEAKLSNSHIKNNNYESEYIGPSRLTKHMGFLAKGKISDSITRLEEVVPDNLKARTKQDLHRILELSNGTKTNTQTSDSFHQTRRYIRQTISPAEESSSDTIEEDRISSPVKPFVTDKLKDNGELSVRLTGKKSVLSSGGKSSAESTPQSRNEVAICQEIITKKLHPVVMSANASIFPNVCNQTKLRQELLDIKNQYESSRKITSSSSNYESSQDNSNTSLIDGMKTNDFCLNPVLTQSTSTGNELESMFPDSQDYSSESEEEVYIDAQTLLQRKALDSSVLDEFDSKQRTSSSVMDSSVILIPSSVSSNGSPIWKPKLSPGKFIPDFPPTPKIYYRQKMF